MYIKKKRKKKLTENLCCWKLKLVEQKQKMSRKQSQCDGHIVTPGEKSEKLELATVISHIKCGNIFESISCRPKKNEYYFIYFCLLQITIQDPTNQVLINMKMFQKLLQSQRIHFTTKIPISLLIISSYICMLNATAA